MAKKEIQYSIKINGIPQANKDLKSLKDNLSDSQKEIEKGNKEINKSILIIQDSSKKALDMNKEVQTMIKNSQDFRNVLQQNEKAGNAYKSLNKNLQETTDNAKESEGTLSRLYDKYTGWSNEYKESLDNDYIELEKHLNKGEKSKAKTVTKILAKRVNDGIKDFVDNPVEFGLDILADDIVDKVIGSPLSGPLAAIGIVTGTLETIGDIIQESNREYYSIFDESFHDTLTALDLYNESYIAKEKARIDTLMGFEKEYAEKKLAINIKAARNRREGYRGRDWLETEYAKQNRIDPINHTVRAIAGQFPMDLREKAKLNKKITDYRSWVEKKREKDLQNLDYEYGYNSPEAVVYPEANEIPKKKKTKKKTVTSKPVVEDTRPKPDDISTEIKPLETEDVLSKHEANKAQSIEKFAEANKQQYKAETEALNEEKNKRVDILSQLAQAYIDNTAGVKDAFGTILGTFTNVDPIVAGLLNVAEKHLPKLLSLFQKTNEDINKDVKDSTKERNDTVGEGMGEANEIVKTELEKIQEHVQLVIEGIGMVFEAINQSLDQRIEEAKERYEALSEKYDEVAEKVKESNDRIQSLHEEAKEAQGGRLVIIQEQISREMEANQSLVDQEQSLAKDKEAADAEKEKLEKQKKKNELKMQIVQAVANIAFGITQALALGPILGPIMAAVLAAAGAIQIAKLNKQMSKLADGGLLNGKPHAQGGMRIEGTNIEVEGGEYVINRVSTHKNLGLVRYINSQRRQLSPQDINGYFGNGGGYHESPNFKTMFASGGQLPADSTMNTFDNDRMIRAIESINMQPVVSVVDIANVQQNLAKVTDWTDTSSF